MKHWKYLDYVIRHKWFVFVAGLKMNVSLWRLLKHDWTKLLPSEWTPYVDNFYGEPWSPVGSESLNKFRKRRKDAFEKAWLLHLNRNDHHWQFWLKTDDSGEASCLPISEPARREMIADWMGAGRAITGEWDVVEWYKKNRDKQTIHPETREYVDKVILGGIPQ